QGQWLPDFDSVRANNRSCISSNGFHHDCSRSQIWMRNKNQLRLTRRKAHCLNHESQFPTTEAAERKHGIRRTKFMFTWAIIESQKKTGPAALSAYSHQGSGRLPSCELHSSNICQLRKKSDNHRFEKAALALVNWQRI